ncbi:hypothetical protein A2837_00010 [Candidatus Kaiserbacteria bacterium RIFCSPHIGHO2_01_FULL_46_22]|uniref:General secretion pathway GspH domain-containing protein n=1 Tax=Candidatus Kaiserbacteria bacterium RIFCSPHIGHO2_01_FULL_46_22 TaxID=1798475 RepID=A0A1F6BYQ9_9BACT|nr:MAG: hypothetical protein A2837_00010 [Candidatus Kaiserbacteria bacterium RIFCSPHIGHO2_01_FULL_46_22]
MKKKYSSVRGFSILEVLITAGIIGLITGIIVLKYGAFNNLILLKNQAFQVALDLRETQTRALSAQGQTGTAFRDGYGIYFATAASDRYVLFVDTNDNNVYNSGEELETRMLDTRFMISGLCNNSSCGLTTMSIVFKRPNFDALINNGAISTGKVNVTPKNGATNVRTIVVNAAGQISVE